MTVEPRYTKHQVARTTRPDAERNCILYLIKACSYLRLTYQIRLLVSSAESSQRKVVIDVPKTCRIDPALQTFCKEHAKLLKIRKV